jgi:hypothetical protein
MFVRHWNRVRSARSVKYICRMCNYMSAQYICIIFFECAGRMCKLRQIESQARFTQGSVEY